MVEDLIGKHKSDLQNSKSSSVKLWALYYLDSCKVTKAHSVKGQASVSSHIKKFDLKINKY